MARRLRKPLIVSPSYRRAGRTKIRAVLPKVVLAVHEEEADEYREKDGEPIVVIPDKVKGNMGRVRNWILDWGWEKTKWLTMVDDDVSGFGFFQYQGRERAASTKWTVSHRYISGEEITDLLYQGYVMAEDLGVQLWGINLSADPKWYRQYSPLSMLSPVLGPFSNHLDHPLRYDERLGLNEDYDMFIQHVHRYRKVLRLNKFFYLADHLDQSGGCAAWRQLDEERRQAKIMQQKWGPDVVSYNFRKSTNPRVRVPIRGI